MTTGAMQPRFPKQLFLHKPEEGIYGDCHRTVIACLLGLEPAEVPHFGHGGADAETFHQRKRDFLATHGLFEFTVCYTADLDDVLETIASQNPGAVYILGGMSRTGVNHSVLFQGRRLLHDPSLTDAGIVGPMDDGFYRVSFLILQPELPS